MVRVSLAEAGVGNASSRDRVSPASSRQAVSVRFMGQSPFNHSVVAVRDCSEAVRMYELWYFSWKCTASRISAAVQCTPVGAMTRLKS